MHYVAYGILPVQFVYLLPGAQSAMGWNEMSPRHRHPGQGVIYRGGLMIRAKVRFRVRVRVRVSSYL